MARELAGTDRRERKFTVTVASPSECKRVLSIEISKEEIEKAEAKALASFRRDLKVPGFRKGKVPLKYIEKNYGTVIHGDAVQNLLPAVYEDALVREGIKPVGEPKFENLKAEPGEDVSVDIVVEVRPELELRDYEGVKVKVSKRVIGDSEVDETLERVRQQSAVFVVVDREVREGDFLLIDYAPLLDSGEIDRAKVTRNYPLDLSTGSLLPELREGLLGMRIKDEKDIHVEYPRDFPDREMAGTSRTIRVTMKEVKDKRVPDLNDEFAQQLGKNFADLAALKERIKEDLDKEEEKRREHEIEEMIIDRVIENNPFEVPEAMVENYLTSVLEEDRQRRPNVPDEAARENEIREHFGDVAVRTIKKFLILEAVRKQESIELTRDEVDSKIDEISKDGGVKAEEIKQYFKHPERRRSLENELLDKKAIEFLRQNADVKVA
ncbi:MAG: trigger factor [Candidatus Latescibacterota bacterium]|nr:MAG: trigger factor [Candidatus Latescibacterota bacterium]